MAFANSFRGGGPKKHVSVKGGDCWVRSSSEAGMDAADRFRVCNAFARPLARWWTSGRVPHDEGSIPQCAVWGIWPTAFKASGQNLRYQIASYGRELQGAVEEGSLYAGLG